MEPAKGKKVSVVYLVAGMSSRFGGKIKQFAIVGPKGETLIEVSMKQAISAGVGEVVFIVGNMTEVPFKEKFGDSFLGVPIKYARQVFDSKERDRPWGTTDAAVCIKDIVGSPFILCNGDDLYGENSFRIMREFLQESADDSECASAGYELGSVLPKSGGVNRAVYSMGEGGFIKGMEECFNIERSNLSARGFNEATLVSMNLFGLKPCTLSLLEERLTLFKKTHVGDRRAECLLPIELGALINEGRIKLKLLKTFDKWLGVTAPGDEDDVRLALSKK